MKNKITQYRVIIYRGTFPLSVKFNAKHRKSLYKQIKSHLKTCDSIDWHCNFKGEIRYFHNNHKIDKEENILRKVGYNIIF